MMSVRSIGSTAAASSHGAWSALDATARGPPARARLVVRAASTERTAELATVSRRAAVTLLPFGAVLAGPAAALAAPAPGSAASTWMEGGGEEPKFLSTPGGVKVQVITEGAGNAAGPGDRVLLDYVLRRSNGYFIYGTVEGVSFQPRDVPTGEVLVSLGAGEIIPGLEEVLTGMRAGSKVRALIPPALGYEAAPEAGPKMPTFATARQLENHRREPLLFEVQVLRVLPSGGK